MKVKSPIISQWLSAPTDLELALLYLLLGFYIGVATDAVISFVWLSFVLFSLSTIKLLMAIRVISFVFAVQAGGGRRFWVRWGHLGLIGVLLTLIFGTNLALMARVWLSEGPLYEEVQYLLSLPADKQKQWLGGPLQKGFFDATLKEIDSHSGTIWYHTQDGQELYPPPYSLEGGIAYCEQGSPPERGETTYQHLYGPWWRWVQDI